MFSAISSSLFSFLFGSILNLHFYTGVFLGIAFTPLWVKIWTALKNWLLKVDPSLKPILTDVSTVASAVVSYLKPVANVINKDVSKL
jgi:hypothetical protein